MYQTRPGDPLISGYNTITRDISALLGSQVGQTLRLRFAETDNVFTFQMGVDDVRFGVPEPASTCCSARRWPHSSLRAARALGARSPEARCMPRGPAAAGCRQCVLRGAPGEGSTTKTVRLRVAKRGDPQWLVSSF